MKLEVVRFSSQNDSTLGLVFDVTNGRKFLCFSLEDEARDTKIMAETRIPAGIYELKLRTVGGYHSRYLKKYGSWHKGMIHVQDVPNFRWILWHTGNTDEHTSGCLIVGESQNDLDKGKDGFVGASGVAYKKLYPKVADALDKGEDVVIKYHNVKDLLESDEKISDLRGQVKILEAEKAGRKII